MLTPRWLLVLLMACGGSSATDNSANGSTDSADGTDTAGSEDDEDWDEDWGDDEPVVESHEGASEQLGVTGPDKPWAEMTEEEKKWYMIGKVLPIMKEQFAEQNSERWSPAEYECETCHGSNMQEANYAMPPQSSFQVPEPGSQGWQNMERIFPEVVQFMKETVTPTMGTLLGIEDYTCFHCHARSGGGSEG